MVELRKRKPTVPWVSLSFEDQYRFDSMLRQKRKDALGLQAKYHVCKIAGVKTRFCQWCDHMGRVYHYEILDHTWVGYRET